MRQALCVNQRLRYDMKRFNKFFRAMNLGLAERLRSGCTYCVMHSKHFDL